LLDFSAQERENIFRSTYNLTQFPEKLELYNLREDPGETIDYVEVQPEIVQKLLKTVDKH